MAIDKESIGDVWNRRMARAKKILTHSSKPEIYLVSIPHDEDDREFYHELAGEYGLLLVDQGNGWWKIELNPKAGEVE